MANTIFPASFQYKRSNKTPLDDSLVYETLDSLNKDLNNENSNLYVGQILSVINDGKNNGPYYIDEDFNIKRLVSNNDIDVAKITGLQYFTNKLDGIDNNIGDKTIANGLDYYKTNISISSTPWYIHEGLTTTFLNVYEVKNNSITNYGSIVGLNDPEALYIINNNANGVFCLCQHLSLDYGHYCASISLKSICNTTPSNIKLQITDGLTTLAESTIYNSIIKDDTHKYWNNINWEILNINFDLSNTSNIYFRIYIEANSDSLEEIILDNVYIYEVPQSILDNSSYMYNAYNYLTNRLNDNPLSYYHESYIDTKREVDITTDITKLNAYTTVDTSKTMIYIDKNAIYLNGPLKKYDPDKLGAAEDYYSMLIYRGNYDSETTYSKNDEVFYNNSLWVCLQDNTISIEPSTNNSSYWLQVSNVAKPAIQFELKTNTDVLKRICTNDVYSLDSDIIVYGIYKVGGVKTKLENDLIFKLKNNGTDVSTVNAVFDDTNNYYTYTFTKTLFNSTTISTLSNLTVEMWYDGYIQESENIVILQDAVAAVNALTIDLSNEQDRIGVDSDGILQLGTNSSILTTGSGSSTKEYKYIKYDTYAYLYDGKTLSDLHGNTDTYKNYNYATIYNCNNQILSNVFDSDNNLNNSYIDQGSSYIGVKSSLISNSGKEYLYIESYIFEGIHFDNELNKSYNISIHLENTDGLSRSTYYRIYGDLTSKDGISYSLIASENKVKVNAKGNLSTTTISFIRQTNDANGNIYTFNSTNNNENGYLAYTYTGDLNGGKNLISNNKIGIKNTVSKYIIGWYKDSALTNILDKETIPVISDGSNGLSIVASITNDNIYVKLDEDGKLIDNLNSTSTVKMYYNTSLFNLTKIIIYANLIKTDNFNISISNDNFTLSPLNNIQTYTKNDSATTVESVDILISCDNGNKLLNENINIDIYGITSEGEEYLKSAVINVVTQISAENGTSPYWINFVNSTDSVITNYNYLVKEDTLLYGNISVYKGDTTDTKMTITNITIDSSESDNKDSNDNTIILSSWKYNNTNGNLQFLVPKDFILDSSKTLTLNVEFSDGSISHTLNTAFTIIPSRESKDGISPAIYNIVPMYNQVPIINGTLVIDTLTVQVSRSYENSIIMLDINNFSTYNLSLLYSLDSNSNSNDYTNAGISITKDNKYIYLTLKENGEICDTQIVSIIKSGSDNLKADLDNEMDVIGVDSDKILNNLSENTLYNNKKVLGFTTNLSLMYGLSKQQITDISITIIDDNGNEYTCEYSSVTVEDDYYINNSLAVYRFKLNTENYLIDIYLLDTNTTDYTEYFVIILHEGLSFVNTKSYKVKFEVHCKLGDDNADIKNYSTVYYTLTGDSEAKDGSSYKLITNSSTIYRNQWGKFEPETFSATRYIISNGTSDVSALGQCYYMLYDNLTYIGTYTDSSIDIATTYSQHAFNRITTYWAISRDTDTNKYTNIYDKEDVLLLSDANNRIFADLINEEDTIGVGSNGILELDTTEYAYTAPDSTIVKLKNKQFTTVGYLYNGDDLMILNYQSDKTKVISIYDSKNNLVPNVGKTTSTNNVSFNYENYKKGSRIGAELYIMDKNGSSGSINDKIFAKLDVCLYDGLSFDTLNNSYTIALTLYANPSKYNKQEINRTTYYKIYGDLAAKDGVSFVLQPSCNSIKVNNSNVITTGSEITFNRYLVDSNGEYTDYSSQGILTYTYYGCDNDISISNNKIGVEYDKQYYEVTWWKDNEKTIKYDRETIPVTADGQDGLGSVLATIVGGNIYIPINSDGKTTLDYSSYFKLQLDYGDTSCDITKVVIDKPTNENLYIDNKLKTAITISKELWTNYKDDGIEITIANGKTLAQESVNISITGTNPNDNDKEYTKDVKLNIIPMTQGLPGSSPYNIYLTNPMDGVVTNPDNTVYAEKTLQTDIIVSKGTQNLQIASCSIDNDDSDYKDKNNKEISFKLEDNTYSITIPQGFYLEDTIALTLNVSFSDTDGSTVSRNVIFSICPNRIGDDGKVPPIYNILPKYYQIPIIDNKLVVDTLSCSIKKEYDGDITTYTSYIDWSPYGLILSYNTYINTASINYDEQGIPLSSDYKFINLELTYEGKILDTQTVTFSKSAIDNLKADLDNEMDVIGVDSDKILNNLDTDYIEFNTNLTLNYGTIAQEITEWNNIQIIGENQSTDINITKQEDNTYLGTYVKDGKTLLEILIGSSDENNIYPITIRAYEGLSFVDTKTYKIKFSVICDKNAYDSTQNWCTVYYTLTGDSAAKDGSSYKLITNSSAIYKNWANEFYPNNFTASKYIISNGTSKLSDVGQCYYMLYDNLTYIGTYTDSSINITTAYSQHAFNRITTYWATSRNVDTNEYTNIYDKEDVLLLSDAVNATFVDLSNEQDRIGVGDDGILQLPKSTPYLNYIDTTNNINTWYKTFISTAYFYNGNDLLDILVSGTKYSNVKIYDYYGNTIKNLIPNATTFNSAYWKDGSSRIGAKLDISSDNKYAILYTYIYDGIGFTDVANSYSICINLYTNKTDSNGHNIYRSTYYKIYGDLAAKDAMTYSLICSNTSIKVSNNKISSDNPISVSRYIIDGNGTQQSGSNIGLLTYTYNGSSNNYLALSSNKFGVETNKQYYEVTWWADAKHTIILDKETIPVNTDGVDGKGSFVLTISPINIYVSVDDDGIVKEAVNQTIDIYTQYGEETCTMTSIVNDTITIDGISLDNKQTINYDNKNSLTISLTINKNIALKTTYTIKFTVNANYVGTNINLITTGLIENINIIPQYPGDPGEGIKKILTFNCVSPSNEMLADDIYNNATVKTVTPKVGYYTWQLTLNFNTTFDFDNTTKYSAFIDSDEYKNYCINKDAEWICIGSCSSGSIRFRGEFVSNETYYNNNEFIDIVIYNGNYYKLANTTDTKGVQKTSFDINDWKEFNEFSTLSTSVLLAGSGYIDVLGSSQLFVGTNSTDTYNSAKSTRSGWLMTQGSISYISNGSESGVKLNSDGTAYITQAYIGTSLNNGWILNSGSISYVNKTSINNTVQRLSQPLSVSNILGVDQNEIGITTVSLNADGTLYAGQAYIGNDMKNGWVMNNGYIAYLNNGNVTGIKLQSNGTAYITQAYIGNNPSNGWILNSGYIAYLNNGKTKGIKLNSDGTAYLTQAYIGNNTSNGWVINNGYIAYLNNGKTKGVKLNSDGSAYLTQAYIGSNANNGWIINNGYIAYLNNGQTKGIKLNSDGSAYLTNTYIGNSINDGWIINNGSIKHSSTNLELTKEGSLVIPEGKLSFKVGEDTKTLSEELSSYTSKKFNLLSGTDFKPSKYVTTSFTTGSEASNSAVLDTTTIYNNNYSYKLISNIQKTFTSTTNVLYTNVNLHSSTDTYLQVKSNTKYTISLFVKSNKSTFTNISNPSITIKITCFNSGKTTSSSFQQTFADNNNDFSLYSYTFTTPENTSYIYITLFNCTPFYGYNSSRTFDLTTTDANKALITYINSPMLVEGEINFVWNYSCDDLDLTNNTELTTNLLATGIDIETRKITFTSDNFVVRNNNGEITGNLDDDGDLYISGSLSQGQHLPSKTLKEFTKYFIPFSKINGETELSKALCCSCQTYSTLNNSVISNTFWNGSSYQEIESINNVAINNQDNSWYVLKLDTGLKTYMSTNNISSYTINSGVINKSIYYNSYTTIRCISPILSSFNNINSYVSPSGEDFQERLYCSLDMAKANGLIEINKLVEHDYEDYTDYLTIFLPWLFIYNIDLDKVNDENYHFNEYVNYCKTPTTLGNKPLHFITYDEIKSLVGRTITLANNTDKPMYIYYGPLCDNTIANNSYPTFIYDKYGNIILPNAEWISNEAGYDSSNSKYHYWWKQTSENSYINYPRLTSENIYTINESSNNGVTTTNITTVRLTILPKQSQSFEFKLVDGYNEILKYDINTGKIVENNSYGLDINVGYPLYFWQPTNHGIEFEMEVETGEDPDDGDTVRIQAKLSRSTSTIKTFTTDEVSSSIDIFGECIYI